MSTFKYVVFIVGATFCFLLFIGLIGFIAQGYDFFMFKVFAPAYEQARREQFEQSKAYNDGMAQELRAMQFDYMKADAAHKDALRSIILHRVAGNEERLPTDLKSFIADLRKGN